MIWERGLNPKEQIFWKEGRTNEKAGNKKKAIKRILGKKGVKAGVKLTDFQIKIFNSLKEGKVVEEIAKELEKHSHTIRANANRLVGLTEEEK